MAVRTAILSAEGEKQKPEKEVTHDSPVNYVPSAFLFLFIFACRSLFLFVLLCGSLMAQIWHKNLRVNSRWSSAAKSQDHNAGSVMRLELQHPA